MVKKAVVFDNSGTLIKRYRVVKNIENNAFLTDKNSLELIDNLEKGILVVIQVNPDKCFMRLSPNMTMYDFIKKYNICFDISYKSRNSNFKVSKNQVMNILKEEKTTLKELQETVKEVKKRCDNIELCSGSAIMVDLITGKVRYTITAAGKIFPEVRNVMKILQRKNIKIFIASGDRKGSLYNLAKLIDIPTQSIYDTASTIRKKEIVKELKKKYKVMMVGNAQNDVLAFKEADFSVVTLQQKEKVPEEVYKSADLRIDNIKEILNTDFIKN